MIITILASVVICTSSFLQADGMNAKPFSFKKQDVSVPDRANPPACHVSSETTQVEECIAAAARQLSLAITSMARVWGANPSEGETLRLGKFTVLSCVATLAYEPSNSGKDVEKQRLDMNCNWQEPTKTTVDFLPGNSKEYSKVLVSLCHLNLCEDKAVIPKADAPTEGQEKKEGQEEKSGKGKEKQEGQKEKTGKGKEKREGKKEKTGKGKEKQEGKK